MACSGVADLVSLTASWKAAFPLLAVLSPAVFDVLVPAVTAFFECCPLDSPCSGGEFFMREGVGGLPAAGTSLLKPAGDLEPYRNAPPASRIMPARGAVRR